MRPYVIIAVVQAAFAVATLVEGNVPAVMAAACATIFAVTIDSVLLRSELLKLLMIKSRVAEALRDHRAALCGADYVLTMHWTSEELERYWTRVIDINHRVEKYLARKL